MRLLLTLLLVASGFAMPLAAADCVGNACVYEWTNGGCDAQNGYSQRYVSVWFYQPNGAPAFVDVNTYCDAWGGDDYSGHQEFLYVDAYAYDHQGTYQGAALSWYSYTNEYQGDASHDCSSSLDLTAAGQAQHVPLGCVAGDAPRLPTLP